MFATAALADAKMKDSRRKQWDKAIEEAKAGSSATAIALVPSDIEVVDKQRRLERIHTSAFNVYERHLEAEKPFASNTDTTFFDSLLLTQLRLLEDHMEQSFSPIRNLGNAHSAEGVSTQGRNPKTSLHLQKMEGMVARLVAALLLETGKLKAYESQFNYKPRNAPIEDLRLQNQRLKEDLEKIEARRTKLPAYSSLNTTDSAAELQSLHHSIHSLLEQKKARQNLPDIIAKICYNLLISTTPPNEETYTIMIRHFTRMKLHHLSRVMVDSFYNDSMLKPSQETIAAIIYHYVKSSDRAGFKDTIQRMRGSKLDMRIKRRHRTSLMDPNIQKWALTAKVIHRNGYLVEKVHRDSRIFTALINGCVEFSMISQAVVYMKAAFRQGVTLSAAILRRLMAACIETGDKSSAPAVLLIVFRMQARDGLKWDHPQLCRNYISRLLSYCGIEYSLTTGECRGDLPEVDSGAMRTMLRTLHIEELEAKVSKIETLNTELQGLLEKETSDPTAIPEKLLNCMNASSYHEKSALENELERKMDELRSVESHLRDIENTLGAIVFKKLLPSTQRSLLSKRLKMHPDRKREYYYLVANLAAWRWEAERESLKARRYTPRADMNWVSIPLAQVALQQLAKTAEYAPAALVAEYIPSCPPNQLASVAEIFASKRHDEFPTRNQHVPRIGKTYPAYGRMDEEEAQAIAV